MPKNPKELLARWASDEILDPYGPVLGKQGGEDSASSSAADALNQISDPAFSEDLDRQFAMTRTLPLTTAELTASTPTKRTVAATATKTADTPPIAPAPKSKAAEPLSEASSATDSTTNAEVPTKKSDKKEGPPRTAKRSGGSLMVLGQILAYIGVLSVTIGATFVLWGFFGNKPHYAPMGWLVLTAGQMLLFLGIVTLVSGGMEQTTSTVEMRIDDLSEHILRIEQATHLSNGAGKTLSASTKYGSPLNDPPSEAAA